MERQQISERGLRWRRQSARSINFYGGRDAEIRLSVFVVSSAIFSAGTNRGADNSVVLLVTTSLREAMSFAAGHSRDVTLHDPLSWEWVVGGRYWHNGPVRGWEIDKQPLFKVPLWPLLITVAGGVASIIVGAMGLFN